jgi:hypothetical protein
MPIPNPALSQLVADKVAAHNLKALRDADQTVPANRIAYLAARRAFRRDLRKAVRDDLKTRAGV